MTHQSHHNDDRVVQLFRQPSAGDFAQAAARFPETYHTPTYHDEDEGVGELSIGGLLVMFGIVAFIGFICAIGGL